MHAYALHTHTRMRSEKHPLSILNEHIQSILSEAHTRTHTISLSLFLSPSLSLSFSLALSLLLSLSLKHYLCMVMSSD